MAPNSSHRGNTASKVRHSSTPTETKLHTDEATGHVKNGNYSTALSSYNQALELSPGDKNALIARSKCHLLLGEPQRALEDAEAALQEKSKDPSNARAMYYKAEALYHLGDFELSLVYYYRGMRIRPEFDGFRLGVQKAQEAIQNIIGDNSVPIVVTEPSPDKSEQQEFNDPKRMLDKSSQAGDLTNSPCDSVGQGSSRHRSSTPDKRRSNGQNLLGQLNVDKKYLQNLLKHPDIKAPHQGSAEHITTYAEEGIAFLKSRQEFWRQQRATSPIMLSNSRRS